ncbi:periplasmic heavy metal sensor [Candidatus Binatia bacterium]|nr:periplasmic heavy metal sensor [Candidatus Binatia bacterium]
MTSFRYATAIFLLAFAALGSPLSAQPMGHHGGPPMGGPPFFANLFPPNLIMRHDSDLGLSDKQREVIATQIEDAQKTLVSLQWAIERESQKLDKILEPARVDEAAALEQVDRVMAAEQQLKKAHLTLLIRIKNELTAAQQEKLRQLRPARGGGPPPPS